MTAPKVIVFFTDQQRWDTTGAHGNPLDLTPNFDRMAHEGTHVSRSFTCQTGVRAGAFNPADRNVSHAHRLFPQWHRAAT